MKLYKQENIELLYKALESDEFDDELQDTNFQVDEITEPGKQFLDLYLSNKSPFLEIGCGSGNMFSKYPITHAIEPCFSRYQKASVEAGDRNPPVIVHNNVVEAMDFASLTFNAALMINGWFQIRSDYEALIEVNRVMKLHGVFVINLMTSDHLDIVQGRVYGAKNYIRLMKQFGFELMAYLETNAGNRFVPKTAVTTYIAVEKVREFDYRWLSQPQAFNIKNYVPERDFILV